MNKNANVPAHVRDAATRTNGTIRVIAGLTGGLALSVSGCKTPLDSTFRVEPTIEQTIASMVERELATLPAGGAPLALTQPPSVVDDALEERRGELEALTPARGDMPEASSLGPDLTGAEQRSVSLSLESAIRSAVDNNLAIQIASLQPGVSAEDLIVAESAFDAVLFANAELQKIDEPQTVTILNMVTALGTPFRSTESFRFETGVRKRFFSGTELALTTDITRFRNNAADVQLFPDPAYTSAIRLGLTQPLMRGFGEEVNRATIEVAENTEQKAIEQLRRDMLDLVEQTEASYWNLVFAWRVLEIRQWLVDVGVQVRDVLDRRRDFDTKLAEYADAVARVEQRKSEVIRARRQIRFASDQLKILINDPELAIGSEAVLMPVDPFLETPIDYDLRSTILTAVSNRPEVQVALLTVDDATIIRTVADNARQPQLNLTAQIAYLGLDQTRADSYKNATDLEYIDYIVGLNFEYPLGNRGPEADFNRARLQRSQALVGYRNAVQGVVLQVKSALRDVITNYELIQATRSSRIAEAENLRTLLVEEETLAGLTPEFLNLKFQRQERLALTRREEFDALVNFDNALAALYRSMGTGLSMKGISIWDGDEVRVPDLDLVDLPEIE